MVISCSEEKLKVREKLAEMHRKKYKHRGDSEVGIALFLSEQSSSLMSLFSFWQRCLLFLFLFSEVLRN